MQDKKTVQSLSSVCCVSVIRAERVVQTTCSPKYPVTNSVLFLKPYHCIKLSFKPYARRSRVQFHVEIFVYIEWQYESSKSNVIDLFLSFILHQKYNTRTMYAYERKSMETTLHHESFCQYFPWSGVRNRAKIEEKKTLRRPENKSSVQTNINKDQTG